MSTSSDNQETKKAFFAAITAGDVARVRQCLEKDPSLVDCESLDSPDTPGALTDFNAVWACVGSENMECLDAVLSCLRATRGEAIAEKAERNALYWATSCVRESVTLALLQRGVDARWTNAQGETLLMLAAKNNSVASVQALLPLSDINATSNITYTAVSYAASHNSVDCLKLLVVHPDAGQHKRNQNSLLSASLNGNVDCLRLILQHCDFSKNRKAASRALDCGVTRGHVQCVLELLPYWDANARSEDGATVWISAAMCPTPAAVACLEVLLTTGLSLREARGALDAAIAHQNAATADWLAAQAGGSMIESLLSRWPQTHSLPMGVSVQELFPRSWAVWERQKIEGHLNHEPLSTEESSGCEGQTRAKGLTRRL